MSNEALVVLNNDALQVGGLGLDSRLFKLRPATLELVQKMTHQEGAQPGKLRVTSTNEHYDEMHVAFLNTPVQQREMYRKNAEFSRDSKICFSTDFIKPHDKAKEPQAMVCDKCPKGSWAKYNQTKNREDIPECKPFWHLFIVDRVTKMPYYLNIRGKNVSIFEYQMQNWSRVLAMMQANTKAENAAITAQNVEREKAKQELLPLKPMPNVFDISFKIYVVPPQAGSKDVNFTIGFKNFAPIKESDRAEFGTMFVDYVNRRRTGQVTEAEEADAAEAATGDDIVSAPATAPTPAVTIPSTGAVVGEVVGKNEPITI